MVGPYLLSLYEKPLSMDIESLLKAPIRTLPVYEPGRPIEIVAKDFGLDPDAIVKLASNENPLGPCPSAIRAAAQALESIHLYPENSAYFLKKKLANKYGIEPQQIVISAGSNEIFYLLGQALVEPGVEVVMGKSAFITYKIMTLLQGGTPVEVPLDASLSHNLDAMLAAITPRTRLVFLPNPNNPTGTVVDNTALIDFCRKLPEHVVFVYDEAYVEYRENAPNLLPLINEGRRIVCCRTFSKIYGLAGLRIGYGFAPAEVISVLERVRPPFNVGSAAQAAAMAALDDEAFVIQSRETNRKGLEQLYAGLAKLGYQSVPSEGNFVLFKVAPEGNDERAAVLFSELQKQGVIIRPVKGYGLGNYLRVSVGTEEENTRFLEVLGKLT